MILERPILGKILILSRSLARDFVYEKPWACISIASNALDFPKINKVQCIDLLQLVFEDLEYRRDTVDTFTPDHAKQICNFVDKVWDNIDLLMIHCYAGISRSPAVGKAISEVYQPEYASKFDDIFTPNQLVYETLKYQFANRGNVP